MIFLVRQRAALSLHYSNLAYSLLFIFLFTLKQCTKNYCNSMVNKKFVWFCCLVVYFMHTATCFTYILLLEITLFNTVQI